MAAVGFGCVSVPDDVLELEPGLFLRLSQIEPIDPREAQYVSERFPDGATSFVGFYPELITPDSNWEVIPQLEFRVMGVMPKMLDGIEYCFLQHKSSSISHGGWWHASRYNGYLIMEEGILLIHLWQDFSGGQWLWWSMQEDYNGMRFDLSCGPSHRIQEISFGELEVEWGTVEAIGWPPSETIYGDDIPVVIRHNEPAP